MREDLVRLCIKIVSGMCERDNKRRFSVDFF